jgi:hypothetical protein
MPQRLPSRSVVIIAALSILVLGIALALLSRPFRQGGPESGLAALAVPARELAAANAALEQAGLSGAVISPYNTHIVASDFSRLLYLSAAEALNRISGSDPRRTPLLDALERAFSFRVADEAWIPLYIRRGGEELDAASLALSAAAIPVLRSISMPSSRWRNLNGLFWLLPLALGLYFAAARPRHDIRYRLALAFSSAPLMLSASVEALLMALALISCAKALYDSYPLQEAGGQRLVMRVGPRLPFIARIAPYAFSRSACSY